MDWLAGAQLGIGVSGVGKVRDSSESGMDMVRQAEIGNG